MRFMSETVSAEPGPQPAPGAEQYPSLALANSVVALPGGHFVDFLGTPAEANQWLTERGLAPVDVGMQEMCATQLRSLREQIRALFASRVAGLPALPAALSAVNDALTRVSTAPLLQWDEKDGPYRAAPHPTTEIVDHALATLAATRPTCSPLPTPNASPPAAPLPATATCCGTAAATGAPPAAATAPARPAPTPAAPSPGRTEREAGSPHGLAGSAPGV